ncbi:L-aminopeptidase/D-esterase [Acetomicrobium mobile DSM 13181]|uniref:L-aminopeptidase/D-esterase n=1 Tax=Acetomicrobium mobile (strain ATCC BAA-54 / DSM 13181 / JCM 12221 / NGA) TaxID=891968 RepID=I4BWJ6_ACEMN|nr:P1 family peptidase [Acetomicrobium mobile]AFM21653.1 L-aminopeptidase/D-esterase [Acetomicrobium mobile DSM 13181]
MNDSVKITEDERPRARDIGIHIGVFSPGKYNAITDVKGVLVGHCTLIQGHGPLTPGKGPIRTGVTAILPHDGNMFKQKVPAASFVFNGFGKSIGLHQVNELGNLETPILLTNTLNAPIVADALIEWMMKENPEIGIDTCTVNPVVGEINDGFLNDIQGRHVKKEHVFEALTTAQSGQIKEGAVGAGTGSSCMGWKSGIGTSSRVLPQDLGGFTVGVLVLTNFDGLLTVNGAPVGRKLGHIPFKDPGGSVMVITATDAPLYQRHLLRVAKRAVLGLARTGFYGSNGSGDFFIAFSTATTIPHEPTDVTLQGVAMTNDALSSLFLATVETTEEAVINSILKAETTVGRDGNISEAVDIQKLVRILRDYSIE